MDADGWDDDAPLEMPKFEVFHRPLGNNDSFAHEYGKSNNTRGRGGGHGSRQFSNRNNNRNSFGGRSGSDSQTHREEEKCEVMKVPSIYVGRIIGKGGQKISDLQTMSGSRIQVTKEVDGDQTIIKISGDDFAINRAKELIIDLTTERKREEKPPVQAPEIPAAVKEKTFEFIDWQAIWKKSDENAALEWAKYPPIIKNFYKEHQEVTNMSEEEANELRLENNNIVVERVFKEQSGKPILKPVYTFEQAFHNYPEILEEIQKAGFETPTPIQKQAWPLLLSGEDIIGIAQTGTGKTLAFLLPALIHIDGQTTPREERNGPAVLVMAPTRELALQIHKEVTKYQYRGITSLCVYGGGNRREQIKVCTEGVDIIIATPGRLNDLHEAGYLNVKTVTYVVLDEADRMLDMGFEPQIRKVMYCIRPTRQTVMTSATWPIGVRRLAQSFMKDPVQIYVGSLDLAATHTVTQVIQVMPDDENAKFDEFLRFASTLTPDQKVIVFCGRKARADNLSSDLAIAGISCDTLHGDKEQCDREQALVDIANGTIQILVATDLASRGLDIDDIAYVVNYDFPRNIEEYVHRVGRTGRAGKSGESISYFTREDWGQAAELIAILEEAQQPIPEELYGMADRHEAWKKKKEAEGGRGRGRGRFNSRRY